MKTKYDHHIQAILAGASINSEAKKAGVHMNTLRQILIKNPGYQAAKAAGKLHAKGIAPKLKELAEGEGAAAIAEVIGGATLSATATKYGIPAASLAKMVHRTHPGTSLQNRGKTPQELAEIAGQKAGRAQERAEMLRAEVEGMPGYSGAGARRPKKYRFANDLTVQALARAVQQQKENQ